MDSKKNTNDDSGEPDKKRYLYGIVSIEKKLPTTSDSQGKSLTIFPASYLIKEKPLDFTVNPGDIVMIESSCPESIRQYVAMCGGVILTVIQRHNVAVAISPLSWTVLKNYAEGADPESIKPRFLIYNDNKFQNYSIFNFFHSPSTNKYQCNFHAVYSNFQN